MERFTISLEAELAREFDLLIAERGYSNRSEAVRDLLRAELERGTRQARAGASHGVACLSYVFNHHERDLPERLAQIQHAHHDLAIATTHVHLDHDHCLEATLLRGPTEAVTRFADAIRAERGVHHGALNLIAAQEHHAHRHAPVRSANPGGSPPAGDRASHVHLKPRR